MPSKLYQRFVQKTLQDRLVSNMPDLSNGPPTLPDDYRAPVPTLPDGYSGGEVYVGGVRGLHLTRPGVRSKCCLMHIHGGGFTIGSAMESMDLLQHIGSQTALECYSVDYRLAPKYKHADFLGDCVNFYKGLLDMGYETIFVGGESAGGSLTLMTTIALLQQGLPLPAGLYCSSPAVDPNYANEELFLEDMFSAVGNDIIPLYTEPGADLKDPLLAPVYADFTGFPPTLIQCGGGESLSASIVRMIYPMCKAGVDLTFRFAKGMEHTHCMYYGQFPEATQAMRDICNFINDILDLDA